VFVVGCLGDWRGAAAVLFERHSLSGHPAPSREKGQKVAKCITRGIAQRFDSETETMIPVYGGSDPECADTVTSKWAKGSGGPSGSECGLFVAQPIPFGIDEKPDVGHCLRSGASRADKHESTTYVAQPIPLDLRNAGRDPEKHDEVNRQGVGVGKAGDPAHTLTTACVHGVAQPIGFEANMSQHQPSTGGVYQTLTRRTHASVLIPPSMAVRRLTPTECERLQGFPDNHTNIPWRKKEESPDGPRYKALGNSMAVPVMHWIGKRIADAP
jgi:DNA (cytosine-5)-methyltransferase 1